MPIRVTMFGEDYTAEVTPSAHMPISWRSDGATSGSELIAKLLGLGYHQQDIVDAVADADPEFLKKLNRGHFNQRS